MFINSLKYLCIILVLSTLCTDFLAAQEQTLTTQEDYYGSTTNGEAQESEPGQLKDNDSSAEDAVATLLGLIFLAGILLICGAVFFLPSIIAFIRRHRNRWVILVINLVFGGTGIGWLGSLIWSLNKIDDPVKGGSKIDGQGHDPIV